MVDIKFSSFFDRAIVKNAISNASRKILSKAGAFVRTTARRSIRTRKKSASPGSPPSSHLGLLKRLIYFGYDAERETVVVGPNPIRKGVAPALLEYGGTGIVKGKPAKYPAYPYMQPALEKNVDLFAGMFANSVK